jgi:Flp pilus assembly pilin Flp
MRHALRTLALDESGQDLIEYALLTSFLSLVSMLALQRLGPTMADLFHTIRQCFGNWIV